YRLKSNEINPCSFPDECAHTVFQTHSQVISEFHTSLSSLVILLAPVRHLPFRGCKAGLRSIQMTLSPSRCIDKRRDSSSSHSITTRSVNVQFWPGLPA